MTKPIREKLNKMHAEDKAGTGIKVVIAVILLILCIAAFCVPVFGGEGSKYVYSTLTDSGTSKTCHWGIYAYYSVSSVDGDTAKVAVDLYLSHLSDSAIGTTVTWLANGKWTIGTSSATTSAISLAPGSRHKLKSWSKNYSKTHAAREVDIACKFATASSDTFSHKSVSVTISPTIPKKTSYTVKYAANGGSSTPDNQTKWYGEALTLRGAISRTGYTFTKWKASDGTQYSAGGSYTANEGTTMTAQWSINSYTLTYNANGGSVSPASKTLNYGAAYGTLPTPTRTGYNFAGWFTAASGGSQVSASTTMGAGNTIIYAHWNEKTAALTYNANGHGTAPEAVTMKYTAAANAANAISADGWIFLGWNTEANGTGTWYKPGQQIKAANVIPSAVNLHAIWKQASADYRVMFAVGKSSDDSPQGKATTQSSSEDYGELSNIHGEGYQYEVFQGSVPDGVNNQEKALKRGSEYHTRSRSLRNGSVNAYQSVDGNGAARR